MSASLGFVLSGFAAAIALQFAADYGPARLRPWARGCVLWSGLLWAGLVGIALLMLATDAAEGAMQGLGELTWIALLIGSTFFAAGQATRLGAQRLGLPTWLRHGLVLLSAAPAAMIGYTGYVLLRAVVFQDTPFWSETSALGQAFDRLTFWFIGNIAIKVALVRLLYDVRMDAVETRQKKLESEATVARLAALEARLRPHALLNALGGLAGLIRTDAAAAEAMTLALARLLGRTLATSDAPTVALADELALARDYLAVERHRLGDRLGVSFDIAGDAPGLAVPRLALLPLVENAVVHGAGRTAAPVAVAVRARRVGERLLVTVEDDGPPFADGWTGGTGLTSVGERLRLLYGDAAALRVTPGAAGEGVAKRVVLDLPAVAVTTGGDDSRDAAPERP